MDVIKHLNALRLERKMSVYRLAELTGINQSTLANTFSRGIVPSIANLELLCEAMGLTLSQFFAEDERTVLLTPEEQNFLLDYKKLPADVQNALREIAKSVSNSTNR